MPDLPEGKSTEGEFRAQDPQTIEATLRTEVNHNAEELWRDGKVVSISLRRHGNYERNPESGMRGSLTPESIGEVKDLAQNWAARVPENAEVAILQSPSFMPAHLNDKEVDPKRATVTASLYERAVFGSEERRPPLIRNDEGKLVSARRQTEARLGDFLEAATTSVASCYQTLRGSRYGRMTEEFWADYVRDSLDPEVAEAIAAVGGADSLQLAANLAEVISEIGRNLAQKSTEEPEPRKEVAIAVTHGETMDSFMHYVAQYLQDQGHTEIAQAVRQSAEGGFSYNEGIDVHVSGNQAIITIEQKGQHSLIEVDLEDLNDYLSDLRRVKS